MTDIDTQTAQLSAILDRRLAIKGPAFADQIRRAVRLLPRHLRPQAQLVQQAVDLGGQPRALRQLDEARVARACEELSVYFEGLDLAQMRRTRILSVLAAIVFNLLVVFTALVVFLRVYGYI
ncbi:hypothetical protein [Roseobacter sp.]|uniref:hypothetical protein n=1 Tax=Roseobacter sp. TaxID=1907202 RepID=UPI003298B620